MSSIRPNPAQFQALATSDKMGPVVMLNLLKYRERSADGDDSGAAAYRRYGDAVIKMIEDTGGRLLWSGRADQVLIGSPEEDWDAVLLVEYPSRQAFIDMVARPDYQQAHEHRESGLERTIVIACTPAGESALHER